MKRIGQMRFATITQQMINREILVPTNQSVQLATDLGPSARIGTFMLQNLAANPFKIYMTQQKVTDPATFLPPFVEIVPGASPVFQIAAQSNEGALVVWDLTHFWLIGDDEFVGQTETIALTAFPLAGD